MFVVCLLASALPAMAQIPTADQLELLRTMSPEDRAALMQQLGLSDTMLSDSGASAGNDNRRADARTQEEARRRAAGVDGQLELKDLSLRPDDSLLIEIDFKRDKPARVESQGQGLPPLNIPAEPAPVLEPSEKLELQELINRVRARNPYQLDRTGSLALPGFAPMALAGLDENQATRRLSLEPSLLKLEVKLTRLPVRKTGVAGLKPFGYDLFKGGPNTFAPVTDVPVPSDYIVGAGDQINVQLFGSANRNLKLTVSRDGRVNFPELGPINVAGRTFAQVSSEIEQRVEQQMIGVRASVGMGDTRSIRVFVMGEANRPGTYTVSGLATITSALYALRRREELRLAARHPAQAPGRHRAPARPLRSAPAR